MAHSASSRRRFVFSRALLAGIGATSLLLAGCDRTQSVANKSVNEKLADASIKLDEANRLVDDATMKMSDKSANPAEIATEMSNAQNARQAAQSELDAAVNQTDASLPVQLHAMVMRADNQLHLAQWQSNKILANDVQIDRLNSEISELANQIQANNDQTAALALYDPTRKVNSQGGSAMSMQDAVDARKAEIAGTDDKSVWYKAPDLTAETALAAVSSNTKRADDLQAQITQLKATIDTEMQQRQDALDQADKLTQQSQKSSSAKDPAQKNKDRAASVDLYVQGSDARKKAADLSVKLNADNNALTRAQADLSVVKSQQDSSASATKALEANSTSFADDWKGSTGVQSTIAEVKKKSREVLGEEPANPPTRDSKTLDLKTGSTIASKAAAIAVLVKENDDARSKAEPLYKSAADFYNNAYDMATKVSGELNSKLTDPTKPDQQAFAAEIAALEPSGYRLHQAEAKLQTAEFFSRSASEAKSRLDLINRLQTILKTADLQSPPSLDDASGKIAKQLTDEQASARTQFADSADLLGKIFESSSADHPEVRAAAKAQQILALYGLSLLENQAGDSAKASERLAAAGRALAEAKSERINLPEMPAEIPSGPDARKPTK